jgi:hypothetical protein
MQMGHFVPTIGFWYQEADSGQLFEVVSVDHEAGTVEVQYLGGEIADFDIEAWAELALAPAAAPEDWRSAFELDSDDIQDPDAAMHPLQWGSPLAGIEPDRMLGVDEL